MLQLNIKDTDVILVSNVFLENSAPLNHTILYLSYLKKTHWWVDHLERRN
jgi:hypothetical protein